MESLGEATLVKSGVTVVRASLRRSKSGLIVQTQADPSIEDLFREWGGGNYDYASNEGRGWVSDTPLRVWELRQNPGVMEHSSGSYSVGHAGGSLVLPGGVINLSFLRVVGVSTPPGITFEVRGVFTLDSIREIAKKITSASKSFYRDFVLPVDISVAITSNQQETRL